MAHRTAHDLGTVIVAADLDAMGYVDHARYLFWVQAAVVGHWRARAPAVAVDAYLWVALRHTIAYRRPARLHDAVIATAVLTGVRRESAYYDTTIRRGSVVLAQVTSRWCCLDALTLQPARLPANIVAHVLGDAPAGA